MIDTSKAKISTLYLHRVGNRIRQEGCILSETPQALTKEQEGAVMKFFFSRIHQSDRFEFSHPVSVEMNEVRTLCETIRKSSSSMGTASQDIAKLLYEASGHPKIKEGCLFIARFDGILTDGNIGGAIGLFKSESIEQFIKTDVTKKGVQIHLEHGAALSSVDKVAVICAPKGKPFGDIYINCSRGEDSVFWIDRFLQVVPVSTAKAQTSAFIKLCEQFTEQVVAEGNEAEARVFLNRSIDFLGKTEKFNSASFDSVFEADEQRERFCKFKAEYSRETAADFSSPFEIAKKEVTKARTRIQRNIKLDEKIEVRLNFSSIAEMDERVERGYDKKKGLKFIKLFYEGEGN